MCISLENKELQNELLTIRQRLFESSADLVNALKHNSLTDEKVKKLKTLVLTAKSMLRDEHVSLTMKIFSFMKFKQCR